jgi:NAD(P)-dependent dehydrogenase (short-subunit alcohol dehydrogenase family)
LRSHLDKLVRIDVPSTSPGSFAGKTVLITGASSGIGREAALRFAAAGANVVLVARRAKALAETAARASRSGVRILIAPADVTTRAAVVACFRKAIAEFGNVDIVINNAGVVIPGRVANLRARDLQAMLDVNLFGALHVMQEAVRRMRAGSGGHIVNVASLAGRRGFSPLGGYSATKFALIGLTEALRTDLVGEPIHVSLILPGVVDTPMASAVQARPGAGELWPRALNLPASWVVKAMFLAIRFRLTEVAVPPGAALLEKLASLAPGVPDALLHWATSSRAGTTATRKPSKAARGRTKGTRK